jgi:hypothetical protein
MKRFIGICSLAAALAMLTWGHAAADPNPAFQTDPNIFTGATNDFYFNGTLADPVPPTASAGATTGGSCSSANTYRLYVSFENSTGETDLSPPSIEFTPASGTTNIVTVTRPLVPLAVFNRINTWSAWFTSSSDGHVAVRGCSTDGAVADTAKATLSFSCLCGTIYDPDEPTVNKTNDIYVIRITNSTAEASVEFFSAGFEIQSLSGDTEIVMYKDGAIAISIREDSLGVPACRSDLSLMSPGLCLQTSTGLLVFKDASGAFYRDGTVAQ